jgi:hypothetical protein
MKASSYRVSWRHALRGPRWLQLVTKGSEGACLDFVATREFCSVRWGSSVGEEARGYKWRDAWPGNTLALKHGAYSEGFMQPLADDLSQDLLERRPDLATYPEAVSAWAYAETRAAIWRMLLDRGGLVDGNHDVREKWLKELRADERRAAEERRNLGLDPASHARLMRERAEATSKAIDLDSIRERGRRAIEDRGA